MSDGQLDLDKYSRRNVPEWNKGVREATVRMDGISLYLILIPGIIY